MKNVVSIPDGDRFRREVVGNYLISIQEEFQSPMGIGSAAKTTESTVIIGLRKRFQSPMGIGSAAKSQTERIADNVALVSIPDGDRFRREGT